MHVHRFIMFVSLALAAATAAHATEVTFRLVDQNADEIVGSSFTVDNIGVEQDGMLTLEPGTHAVTVYAGFMGIPYPPALYREESLEVDGNPTQTAQFTWKTARLT